MSRSAKIERAVLLAPAFGGGAAEAPLLAQPSYSLGIEIKGSAQEPGKPGVGALGNFNLNPAACPGQMEPEIGAAIWAQMRARDPDPHKQAWGPSPETPAGGVFRYATHTRWFGAGTVQNITTPMLVIRGNLDHIVLPVRSQELYNNLIKLGDGKKELMLVGCSSHVMPWEGCTGNGCTAPYKLLQAETIRWVNEGPR